MKLVWTMRMRNLLDLPSRSTFDVRPLCPTRTDFHFEVLYSVLVSTYDGVLSDLSSVLGIVLPVRWSPNVDPGSIMSFRRPAALRLLAISCFWLEFTLAIPSPASSLLQIDKPSSSPFVGCLSLLSMVLAIFVFSGRRLFAHHSCREWGLARFPMSSHLSCQRLAITMLGSVRNPRFWNRISVSMFLCHFFCWLVGISITFHLPFMNLWHIVGVWLSRSTTITIWLSFLCCPTFLANALPSLCLVVCKIRSLSAWSCVPFSVGWLAFRSLFCLPLMNLWHIVGVWPTRSTTITIWLGFLCCPTFLANALPSLCLVVCKIRSLSAWSCVPFSVGWLAFRSLFCLPLMNLWHIVGVWPTRSTTITIWLGFLWF